MNACERLYRERLLVYGRSWLFTVVHNRSRSFIVVHGFGDLQLDNLIPVLVSKTQRLGLLRTKYNIFLIQHLRFYTLQRINHAIDM